MKVAELCQVCSWYSYCSLHNRFTARTHVFILWHMLMLTRNLLLWTVTKRLMSIILS